jgi:SAM-dependent methyltransferase
VKTKLIKIHWLFSSQLGIDPYRFWLSVKGIPAFFADWLCFRKNYSGTMDFMPCLHDRYEEGGSTKSEYFWQDLLVARWIFEAKPHRHVDVGSRVDGFVAHLASYREIEVFDVRPISTRIPGVVFKQADLMQKHNFNSGEDGYCDSISCLHAIEHFGLGRYGDPIDPFGYERGIENMAKLLKPRGYFYLSTPIGKERVEFNANRVFDPRTIICCAEKNGLKIKSITVVSGGGEPVDVPLASDAFDELAVGRYNLGIFVFIKSEAGCI